MATASHGRTFILITVISFSLLSFTTVHCHENAHTVSSSAFGSSSLFNSILLQVTAEKLAELKAQHQLMSEHFQPVLDSIAVNDNDNGSTAAWIPDVALIKLYKAARDSPIKNLLRDEETMLDTVKYFLTAMAADLSISDQITRVWVEKLTQEIEYALRKCEYSFLYGALLSEWLEVENKNKGTAVVKSTPGTPTVAVTKEKALQELQAFMFTPPPTPFNKTRFLTTLREEIFNVSGNAAEQKLLDSVKQDIRETLGLQRAQVTAAELRACIEGLRSEEYVAQKKKTALHQLGENGEVLEEVASLLTNKLRQLRLWEPGVDIKLELTRGLVGQWRETLQEDVITMLFMRYIGVIWGTRFKNSFLRLYDGLWKKAGHGNHLEPHATSINAFRNTNFRRGLLSELPDSMYGQRAKNTNEYVQLESVSSPSHIHRPIVTHEGEPEPKVGSVAEEAVYIPPATESYGRRSFRRGGSKKSQKRKKVRPPQPHLEIDLRQSFLHILSTEIKLSHTIRPALPLVVVQLSYKQFTATLAHEPLLAILEFFDVPQEWLEFFTKFLRTPLEGKERVRGIPDSHALGSFFGEVALFVLDFHVNRVTGLNLHRTHDQFWIWGSDLERVTEAWRIMKEFGSSLGLRVDLKRSGSISTYTERKLPEKGAAAPAELPTGSVRWAYLELAPNGRFTIDQPALEKFMGEMKALLEKSTTALEYINVYNKYMEFFLRNFGRNAYVFGDPHTVQVVDSLRSIHGRLFHTRTGGNVVRALKEKFGGNLTRMDLVDVWMYWPLERGGLGLVDPFLETLALHATYEEAAAKHAGAGVEEFEFEPLLLQDQNNYDAYRKEIEERNKKRAQGVAVGVGVEAEKVPTYEAWSAGRESEAGFQHWYLRYVKLLERPSGLQPPLITAGGPAADVYWGMGTGKGEDGDSLHMQWIYSHYEPQLLKHFGTVEFINTKLLPMSMIANIRKSKVKH